MPNIQEALNRLWADVSRFGPSIPEIRLPVIIEVPPPPPPPPPPPTNSLLDSLTDWATENPWKASSLGVGVAGFGLLVGYNAYRARTQSRLHKRHHTTTHERRQVVGVYLLVIMRNSPPDPSSCHQSCSVATIQSRFLSSSPLRRKDLSSSQVLLHPRPWTSSNAQGGATSRHSSLIHSRCANCIPRNLQLLSQSHFVIHSPPRSRSSSAPWPPLYLTDSQSTPMAIRIPPPRRIPLSTPSSPSSVSPDSPPSPRWNTSSSRANTSSISTPRTSLLSISSRPSCRSCATRLHARATPSKTARARRPSSYAFPPSTRESGCPSRGQAR